MSTSVNLQGLRWFNVVRLGLALADLETGFCPLGSRVSISKKKEVWSLLVSQKEPGCGQAPLNFFQPTVQLSLRTIVRRLCCGKARFIGPIVDLHTFNIEAGCAQP